MSIHFSRVEKHLVSDPNQPVLSIIKRGMLLGLLSTIAVIALGNFVLQPSFSSEIISFGNNGTAHANCNCVVFRMDDIQDYWVKTGQLTAMDQFSSRNQSLTIGIIMNSIGNDTEIVNKVKQGNDIGLFELAIHGWNHTDYTNLSEEEQKNSLYESNKKMSALFGKASEIFIPPYDAFDRDTINAMKQVDMKIINANGSSLDQLELEEINYNDKSRALSSGSIQAKEIFYIPSTIAFIDYPLGQRIENSVQSIFNITTQSIEAHGYAVIVIHPQDFMKIDANGSVTNELDENQISDLSHLIDMILSNNIRLGSLTEVVKAKN